MRHGRQSGPLDQALHGVRAGEASAVIDNAVTGNGDHGIFLTGSTGLVNGNVATFNNNDSMSENIEPCAGDVGEDDLAGTVTLVGPGGLPVAADLAGYHREANGDELFSLDVGATLAGPLTVEARDVVRWDGAVFTIELDGSTEGIPPGVHRCGEPPQRPRFGRHFDRPVLVALSSAPLLRSW